MLCIYIYICVCIMCDPSRSLKPPKTLCVFCFGFRGAAHAESLASGGSAAVGSQRGATLVGGCWEVHGSWYDQKKNIGPQY